MTKRILSDEGEEAVDPRMDTNGEENAFFKSDIFGHFRTFLGVSPLFSWGLWCFWFVDRTWMVSGGWAKGCWGGGLWLVSCGWGDSCGSGGAKKVDTKRRK